MRKHAFVCLVLLATLGGTPRAARADESSAHAAAHLGASFALTTIFYGAFHKAGMPRVPALMFSATLSFAAGLMYKANEPGPPPPGTFQRAMLENAAGIGAASLTITAFEF